VGVEARLTLEVGTTSILPAAVRHQTEVALNLGALTAAGVEPDATALKELTAPLSGLRLALATLRSALDERGGFTAMEDARHARDALLPAMAAVRAAADDLEGVVADDLWPLPTYQEMLYIL
jgi:glutamine synthetase